MIYNPTLLDKAVLWWCLRSGPGFQHWLQHQPWYYEVYLFPDLDPLVQSMNLALSQKQVQILARELFQAQEELDRLRARLSGEVEPGENSKKELPHV